MDTSIGKVEYYNVHVLKVTCSGNFVLLMLEPGLSSGFQAQVSQDLKKEGLPPFLTNAEYDMPETHFPSRPTSSALYVYYDM